ncbi:hypothetical protein MES4922_10126 [Mesorhizobium ventifaucium]|uniref:Uncharacterized protein n=1 Tax=Mesorhizobium ventifaucium TaxID=666020 RepID=A0ABN8JAW5_9HYPH|nr:hypothetical protein MES4922_10126 [Mesorhizobium ventifaucium]
MADTSAVRHSGKGWPLQAAGQRCARSRITRATRGPRSLGTERARTEHEGVALEPSLIKLLFRSLSTGLYRQDFRWRGQRPKGLFAFLNRAVMLEAQHLTPTDPACRSAAEQSG